MADGPDERSEQVVKEYGAFLRSWTSPRTVGVRTSMARTFLKRIGGLENLSVQSVQGFLGDPDFKTWTRATYYGHLKSFCEWLETVGYIEDPMPQVRAPRRPRGAPRPLSERDVARVLAAARGDVRDWIIVALVTGLRVSEIAKLRGEHVDSDGIFVSGKGDMSTTIPVHPDVLALATRYPAHGYWWPGNDDGHIRAQRISAEVGKLFRSLGITGSIHRCRHTFGTRLIREGVHVRRVQKMMRHANLDTTAGYTAVDADELQRDIMVLPQSINDPPPAA